MIDTTHRCWWTHHRVTELADTGDRLVGAGLPREVLHHAASLLNIDCRLEPVGGEEYNESVSLGSLLAVRRTMTVSLRSFRRPADSSELSSAAFSSFTPCTFGPKSIGPVSSMESKIDYFQE
jgi:hypothetical protein